MAPPLNTALLAPYISFEVFVLPDGNEMVGASAVETTMRSAISTNDNLELVADGLSDAQLKATAGIEEAVALAFRESRRPPWGGITTNDRDTKLHLAVLVRRGRMLAVHSTLGSLHEMLRKGVAKGQLLGTGYLTPEALQTALFDGDVMTLWMGEGPSRRRQGARTKAISGPHVDVDIDPLGDQRHTLSAARAEATVDVLGPGARGSLGISLSRSGVWHRKARNWADYINVTDHILAACDRVVQAGGGSDRFVVFAKKDVELSSVSEAYDLDFEDPGFGGQEPHDDVLNAYEWFSSAVADVEPSGTVGFRFTVVDEDGLSAVLRIVPKSGRWRHVEFGDIGYESGDQPLFTRARDAFALLSPVVYYASGHTVTTTGVMAEHFADVTFGGWRFDPFIDTTETMEKPAGGRPFETMAAWTSETADPSLFGWALRRWNHGWLYCDDRSGELCDFVHFAPDDGEIRIVHIKAAHGTGSRQVAAGPFQEVCAQLQKNLISLTRTRLIDELRHRFASGTAGPLWRDGQPSTDGDGFLADLAAPRVNEAYVAVVVQPHVSDRVIQAARERAGGPSIGVAGQLRRLEHLLVATDMVATKVGARLEVIGYRDP